MAVRVTFSKDNVLEFYCESSQDHDIADYLCELVRDARALAKSADKSTLAKSGVQGLALLRRERENRLAILKDIAGREEAKSQDWSLTWDLRQIANQRAYAAKEEMRQLATELEGS